MNPYIKQKYIIGFIIISIIGFILPFLIKSDSDTYNSLFATSFTIVASFSSIATLFVAIALFDRFGVNAKFKNQQIDHVLELARILTQMRFHFSNGKLVYLYGVKKAPNLEGMPDFSEDKKKVIVISQEYLKEIKVFFRFISDAWLPNDVKNKLEIFNLVGIADFETQSPNNFIYLSVQGAGDRWLTSFPEFTFEEYIKNLNSLFDEIENWLKKHSSIAIDYRGGDI